MIILKANSLAFIPLLEDYFDCDIKYEEEVPPLLKYHELVNKKIPRKNGQRGTIVIGLESLALIEAPYHLDDVKYLFIWEVKDVITLCSSPSLVDLDTIILCNLETHLFELKAVHNLVESVYSKLGRNLPLIEIKSGMELILGNKSGSSVNPKYDEGEGIVKCKALIKYTEMAFTPSDTNYSNEYCEVYQMAAILGIDVFTCTNQYELESMTTNLTHS